VALASWCPRVPCPLNHSPSGGSPRCAHLLLWSVFVCAQQREAGCCGCPQRGHCCWPRSRSRARGIAEGEGLEGETRCKVTFDADTPELLPLVCVSLKRLKFTLQRVWTSRFPRLHQHSCSCNSKSLHTSPPLFWTPTQFNNIQQQEIKGLDCVRPPRASSACAHWNCLGRII